jgi:hypothetical protein
MKVDILRLAGCDHYFWVVSPGRFLVMRHADGRPVIERA